MDFRRGGLFKGMSLMDPKDERAYMKYSLLGVLKTEMIGDARDDDEIYLLFVLFGRLYTCLLFSNFYSHIRNFLRLHH